MSPSPEGAPIASNELITFLNENDALLNSLAAEIAAMDVQPGAEPLSKRTFDSFVQKHDELVAIIRKAKSREELLEDIRPYAYVFNKIVDIRNRYQGKKYNKFYPDDASDVIQGQDRDFNKLRDSVVDFLDAIYKSPIGNAIRDAADKENRERDAKKKR